MNIDYDPYREPLLTYIQKGTKMLGPNMSRFENMSANKESIAIEVSKYATRLAERAQRLSEEMAGALRPVMTDDKPQVSYGKDMEEQPYPPLFSDLRNSFQNIENALNGIENTLSRTAL